MMNKKYIAIAMATLSLFSCMTSGCSFLNKENGFKETSIKAVSPKHEKIVVLANDVLADFVENYTTGISEEYYSMRDNYAMAGARFSWEAETPANEYVLSISTSKDLKEPLTYTTNETQLLVNDLFVDTQYYWQVEGKYETESKYSAVYAFKTAKTPRTIYLEGVKNTRDIGGKKTEDGKTVRQGIAYRGARLDQITSDGIATALKTYGIKTDLDLRKGGEGTAGGISPLGEEVQYFNFSCPYYLDSQAGINSPLNYPNLSSAIKVFANADNYPIYFHCSIGRDRTSMVAMLLLGVLGVPTEDIFMDYEMSFLTGRDFFDTASPTHMVNTFTNTFGYLSMYGDSMSFAESCEAYLLQIGVTAEEIAAIRSNMLE